MLRDFDIDDYILKNYKTKTNEQMAAEIGCTKKTISLHRKKLGVSASDLNKKLHENDDYICSQYGKKLKKALAKELGCSEAYISKVQAQHGLCSSSTLVYTCNEDYFKQIDRPEKAYLLGWIASDGNLYKRDGHQGMVSISLQEKDKEILELFKKELDTTKPISFVQDKRRNTIMGNLQITSDKMYNDLLQIGLCPQKTFLYDLEKLFNSIPEKYHLNFILGYFDGDGSISIPTNGTISKSHVRITGPVKYLRIFQTKLSNYHIDSKILLDKREEDFGSLDLLNTTQKYMFLKLIYNSQSVSLKRKKEKAMELISRIENNVTNRSENIQAVKEYNLWF